MKIPALRSLLLLLLCAAPVRADDGSDLVIGDFSGKTFGAWKATGGAFGAGPTLELRAGLFPPGDAAPGGFAYSGYGGNMATGRLLSPEFTVQRRYLQFLLASRFSPGQEGLRVLVDGQPVRAVCGVSDQLAWFALDLSDLAGRTARVELFDNDPYGAMAAARIVETDTPRDDTRQTMSRTLTAEKKFLLFPVRNKGLASLMTVESDGAFLAKTGVALDPAHPEYWAPLDIGAWHGKPITVRVDMLPRDSRALDAIRQDDALPAPDPAGEKYRPRFHFTARQGSLNDPNGLCFLDGEYHLYFQQSPFGYPSGDGKEWGHAVSADLVHWTELAPVFHPIRLPSGLFGQPFSGSAVVDAANTAGFQTGKEPPLVAVFSRTNLGVSIGFSNDRGRTFADFPGNPVLPLQPGRDPKVFWHAPSHAWVMAVYEKVQGQHGIAFYDSPDLKTWTRRSWTPGFYECPDLYPLPLDGDPKQVLWVLHGGNGDYQLGEFDGHAFTPKSEIIHFHYGRNYAAQSFDNIPPSDGRRIQIGWCQSTHVEGTAFNQFQAFPTEMTLRSTPLGPRLRAWPVREIEALRGTPHAWGEQALPEGNLPLEGIGDGLFDLSAELAPGPAGAVGLTVCGIPITYDVKSRTLSCMEVTAPLAPEKGRIRLRVLVDRLSIEIFANDGLLPIVLPARIPDQPPSLSLNASGTGHRLIDLTLYELHP